jgi:hypothetical protein
MRCVARVASHEISVLLTLTWVGMRERLSAEVDCAQKFGGGSLSLTYATTEPLLLSSII